MQQYLLIFCTVKSLVVNIICLLLIILISGCAVENQKSSTSMPLVCPSPEIYKTMTPSSICTSYWSRGQDPCDYYMAQELDKRNLHYGPRSNCGQPKTITPPRLVAPAIPQTCNIQSFSDIDPQSLCRIYINNENRVCDNGIRTELTRRQLKITPPNECGEPLIPEKIAKIEITLPNNILPSCTNVINGFTSHSEPVRAACDFRYKSAVRESIICRKSVTEFINLNSKGVGNNSQTCGLKK